ncbi:hypothetical protein JW905_14560, partial [bacterium]|nr:hypothetical protein [candidate division CSSED10-310 bacterium]
RFIHGTYVGAPAGCSRAGQGYSDACGQWGEWEDESCYNTFPHTMFLTDPLPPPPAGEDCDDLGHMMCNFCGRGSIDGMDRDYADCSGFGQGWFFGSDGVYELILDSTKLVSIIGAATFDADWAVGTELCWEENGSIFCDDFGGMFVLPECREFSGIDVDLRGIMGMDAIMGPGSYYIWVDSFDYSPSGDYAVQVACGPVPETPVCPSEAAFSQAAEGWDENYFFSLCDQGDGSLLAESYSDLVGCITDIRWWGFESMYEYGMGNCAHPGPFDIVFYKDQSGAPSAEKYRFENVTPVKTATGQWYQGIKVFQYQFTPDPVVWMSDGWVSIQAADSGQDCSFFWVGSRDGDLSHACWTAGSWSTATGDQSLCLTTRMIVPSTSLFGVCLLVMLSSILVVRRRR